MNPLLAHLVHKILQDFCGFPMRRFLQLLHTTLFFLPSAWNKL